MRFQLPNTSMVVMTDLKAFVYYWSGAATDTQVYVSKSHNVVEYEPFLSRFVIANPKLCVEKAPFLVIFVKTAPENFDRRKAVRETWGDVGAWPLKSTEKPLVLFVLGYSKVHTESMQEQLVAENRIHRDLIQEGFTEDFHNLTRKLVAQLRWTVIYCPNAKYWMTTDDDVFINLKNVITLLRKSQQHSLYVGFTHFGSPRVEDRKSKYYVPTSVYRGAYYPGYCAGAAYVLSMDVVKTVYLRVPRIPMLYIDDAYMGLLAHSAGISPSRNVMFLGEKLVPTDLCSYSMFLSSHGHNGSAMYEIFKEIVHLMSVDVNLVCWGRMLSNFNPYDIVYF